MASKLLVAPLRPWATVYKLSFGQKSSYLPQKTSNMNQIIIKRYAGQMLPRTQYDTPIPKKLRPFHALFTNWELIPLFFVTFTAMAIMVLSIYWAIGNKVDVVYRPRASARKNLSRTMNLHNPQSHKLLIINQKYEPWPEMTDLVRKLNLKECQLDIKERTCISKRVKKYSENEVLKYEASTMKPKVHDPEAPTIIPRNRCKKPEK